QRVRTAVPPMGEAKTLTEMISAIANRIGYAMKNVHASRIMGEISRVNPGYAGVTYARLERGGLSTPVASLSEQGATILTAKGDTPRPLQPTMLTVPVPRRLTRKQKGTSFHARRSQGFFRHAEAALRPEADDRVSGREAPDDVAVPRPPGPAR